MFIVLQKDGDGNGNGNGNGYGNGDGNGYGYGYGYGDGSATLSENTLRAACISAKTLSLMLEGGCIEMGDKKIDRRIVVMPYGWVFVGHWSDDGTRTTLNHAHSIRRWGTENGLGELAIKGPLSQTKLDYAGAVIFKSGSEVVSIPCETDNWPL